MGFPVTLQDNSTLFPPLPVNIQINQIQNIQGSQITPLTLFIINAGKDYHTIQHYSYIVKRTCEKCL